MDVIYVDKKGNKYYQLKVPESIAMRRATAANMATKEAEFCLTKDALKKMFALMKEYANTGDFTNCFYIMGEIEARMDYAGEEETLLTLASCYFFTENEDITLYIPGGRRRKKSHVAGGRRALLTWLEATKQYANTSINDITPYLRAMGNPLQHPSTSFLGMQ